MVIRKSRVILNGKHQATLKDDFCRKYSGVKHILHPQSVVQIMDDVFKISEQADEYVYIICMTTKCKPICFFEVSHGSQTKAFAEASSILTRVLLCGAPNYIIVHNHPSGDPQPSEEDIMLTERVKEASDLIGVTLADHIIIGRNGYFSFKEMKRMFDTMKKVKDIQSKAVAD